MIDSPCLAFKPLSTTSGMKSAGFDRGAFVTLCGYTGEAWQFAGKNGITILNLRDTGEMPDG